MLESQYALRLAVSDIEIGFQLSYFVKYQNFIRILVMLSMFFSSANTNRLNMKHVHG